MYGTRLIRLVLSHNNVLELINLLERGTQLTKPSTQVRILTPSSARPQANKQSCAKPEWYITMSTVMIKEAIPEKGGY